MYFFLSGCLTLLLFLNREENKIQKPSIDLVVRFIKAAY